MTQKGQVEARSSETIKIIYVQGNGCDVGHTEVRYDPQVTAKGTGQTL